MPDTPDAVRLRLHDALAEVYAGADLADVDALLDQMTDRDLRVADLADYEAALSRALDEVEDRIDILRAEVGLRTRERDEWEANEQEQVAEVTRLREALEGLAKHDRIARGVLRSLTSPGHLPTGDAP